MTVRGLFFDSVAGDRVYDAQDWELIFGSMVQDGYVPNIEEEAEVTPQTPSDMEVVLQTGRVFANGKLIHISADEVLPVTSNSSGSTRIDLAVVRLDYTARTATPHILAGTPGGAAPTPQQDASRWEVPLAEITVANGAVEILAGNILDVRVSAVSDIGIPPGIVSMWSGAIADIPTGWLLCDGTAGTPDLRGRFVVGAGAAYGVGATGGADTVTLTTAQIPAHTHTGPSHNHSGPSHNHSNGSLTAASAGAHTHGHDVYTNASGGANHAQHINGGILSGLITSDSAGAHTHNVTGNTSSAGTGNTGSAGTGNTGSTGSGNSHENRPPYYALAYIMKA